MNANLTGRSVSVLVLALLLGTACSKQSPVETQADVNKAQAEGNRDVAKAQSEAVDATAGAREDVADARTELASDSAKAQQDVAVTAAEAEHKVAVARCGSMTGAQRDACKNEADARLQADKAHAETNRVAADPQK